MLTYKFSSHHLYQGLQWRGGMCTHASLCSWIMCYTGQSAIINASPCPVLSVFDLGSYIYFLNCKYSYSSEGGLEREIGVFELTFQDVPALQLLHVRSLAQPPAEKHQNHVLNHFDFPCPILFKPAVASSLCAFSRGIPYVSISHPNRGCGASAEALPTSGIVEEAQFSGLRILHQIIFRCQDAASQGQPPYCVYSTPPQQHSALLSATDYRRFSTGSWWAAEARLP